MLISFTRLVVDGKNYEVLAIVGTFASFASREHDENTWPVFPELLLLGIIFVNLQVVERVDHERFVRHANTGRVVISVQITDADPCVYRVFNRR